MLCTEARLDYFEWASGRATPLAGKSDCLGNGRRNPAELKHLLRNPPYPLRFPLYQSANEKKMQIFLLRKILIFLPDIAPNKGSHTPRNNLRK